VAGLAAVLGHEVIASSIAQAMEEGPDINMIEGPPGAGKSWFAMGIGALWESAEGTTLVAEGELLQSDAALYPLKRSLAALSSNWREVGSELAQIAKAGESLSGAGGIISRTIEALVRLRPSRQRARKMYLGDSEQMILFDLERLTRKRPLLLIADNLHWWDAESLALLGRLREPAMCEAFPFLAEMRLIGVRTVEPYEKTVNAVACDALLSAGTRRYHRLHRPSREVFPEVLGALDAPPERVAEAANGIFDLTGGHLILAARCAQRMREEGGNFLLSSPDSDAFRQRLLTDRVRSLGTVGSSALAILQIAAVLGLRFRRAEVVCAFEGDPSEASRLLRTCRDEDMIELSEDVGRFAHDLFRQHFLGTGVLETTSVHESISDCLRLLRPGDYQLRCRHAQQAERGREAAALGVEAALEQMREGHRWTALPAHVRAAIESGGMTGVIETFEAAIQHLSGERPSASRDTLNRLPRNLPRRLAAEADYLRATCLLSTRSEEDRETGQALLESWAGYELEEPELGIRLMHLRLYALTLVVDKAPGRRLEGQIRQALLDRGDFDQTAEDAMYTLDRCSGSLHEPDASLPRIREAARHFGPVTGQGVVRRPVEYYRCVVNLGAKLVTNALYEEARPVYEQLEELVAEYAPDTFPRLDFPRTTAVLVGYRLGGTALGDAVACQREIAAADEVNEDPFYAENALAVYLTLAGAGDEALRVFDRLDEELGRRSGPAPSMLYLIRANRSAALYVSGDMDAARRGWAALGDVVERIPYLIRRYLIARHELLGDVMARGEATSPLEFDECLLGVSRFGPLWDQLGRGFRMPEVEWWY